MSVDIHLVLIETAGNQRYIFSTNKLRENIGASEVIYRIGVEFVLQAVEKVGDLKLFDPDEPHPLQLAQRLTNPAQNRPIEEGGSPGVEVVVATSGKALLLVKDRKIGEETVADVTKRALKEAPGAVVYGFVSERFAFDDAERFDQAIKEVHQGIEMLRARLPAPEARFPMLPVVAPCQTSGLPAEAVFDYGRSKQKHPQEDGDDDRPEPDDCAAPVRAKRCNRESGWKRIRDVVDKGLAKNPDRLDDMNLDWRGIIHADGNGVGAIFLNFLNYSDAQSARDYVSEYRQFSCALELCTLAAFNDALSAAVEAKYLRKRPVKLKKGRESILPVVPLVLGGDDLTLVCDGEAAVDLGATFLTKFEERSRQETITLTVEKHKKSFASNVPKIAGKAFGVSRLGICAGVAVVKPHFPFHRAYQLSEALLKSAKTVKRAVKNGAGKPVPCSAFDFHVHFDSSGADLDAIRSQNVVPGEPHGEPAARLYAKPYVMTCPAKLTGTDATPEQASATTDSVAWVRLRQWQAANGRSGLSDAANALRPGGEDDDQNLPRTQQHYLREGLFLGSGAADGRLQQIRHRYNAFPWRTLHPNAPRPSETERPDTLFFDDEWESGEQARRGEEPAKLTWFLDALELAELRGRKRGGRKATDADDDVRQTGAVEHD